MQRMKLRDQIKRVEHLLEANPDLEREYTVKLAFIKAAVTGIETGQSVEPANAQAAELIDRLDNQLQSTRYLAGEQYSLADLAWTTMLERIRMLKMDGLWKDRPAVFQYYQTLRARPSFQAAITAFSGAGVILKMQLSLLATAFRNRLTSSP